jgi:hypothetical protein
MPALEAQLDARTLSRLLQGRTVTQLEVDPEQLAIHFTDASALIIKRTSRGVSVVLHDVKQGAGAQRSKDQPTARQRDYLEFITKYMARYGVAPAESDIQHHFMVSAPAVNTMIKTLERRGFIARGRDFFGNTIPRSIRVLIDSR